VAQVQVRRLGGSVRAFGKRRSSAAVDMEVNESGDYCVSRQVEVSWPWWRSGLDGGQNVAAYFDPPL
jgi:hypothetical protein